MDGMTSIPEITEADRLRVFREDDEALAELAQITHARAIAEGGKDNAAGHLDLKIRERRAAMWRYDSPVRFDMVQVQEHKRPSSFEIDPGCDRSSDRAGASSGASRTRKGGATRS
jgi:hypothetical protein